MGRRNTGRKLAMQALFHLDMNDSDVPRVLNFLFTDDHSEEARAWTNELVDGVMAHYDVLDALIRDFSQNWDFDRISLVDRSLLKLGFYELLYTELRPSIVVNELLDIAKKFSSDDSSKFINGILGAYIKRECLQD